MRSGSQRGAQLVQALARARRHRHDGRVGVRAARQAPAHLVGHERGPFRVNQVELREGHHAARDAQKLQHGQVLLGLRHDAVVGRYAQERQVDACGARDHLAHEALVARHVHHAERAAVRQLQLREPELDGDAAALLLGQAVGVLPGERLHERGLAVVDVARRAQHDAAPARGGAHAPAPAEPNPSK